MVAAHCETSRTQTADPGGERLQRDLTKPARTAAHLRYLHRSARRGDTDGFVATFWRNDGNCRAQRGNQPCPREWHHKIDSEVLPEFQSAGFRRNEALERAATLLAG